MNETPQYPNGIKYRTPRPRGAAAGAILGGLFGYAIGENTESAIGGGLLGAVLMHPPLSLHQALRQKFAENSLDVINFYRLGRFGAKVLFRYQNAYWTLESHAPQNPLMTTEQIEDWLYGDLIEKAENFLAQDSMRLRP
jgi:hypothetical protein